MKTSSPFISESNLKFLRQAYIKHSAIHRLVELEYSRHATGYWPNLHRLGELIKYPNAQVIPSKALSKSKELLDKKLLTIRSMERKLKRQD